LVLPVGAGPAQHPRCPRAHPPPGPPLAGDRGGPGGWPGRRSRERGRQARWRDGSRMACPDPGRPLPPATGPQPNGTGSMVPTVELTLT